MVTRRVIRISPPPRKEAVAPSTAQDEKTSPAPAAAAVAVVVVDSLNNNDSNNLTKTQVNQKPKALLCNHPSCTRRVQHPSPLCWMHCALARDVTCKFSGCNNKGILLGLCPDHGGLVQLCRRRGCINKANLEKRGGLCWMHQEKGEYDHDDDSSSSEEEDDEESIRLCRFRGCISFATTDDGLCDMHAPNHGNSEMSKKRVYASEHSSENDEGKRQRMNEFVIDLTDVPPQPPIPKSFKHIKGGASKYTGVFFDRSRNINKWAVKITIDKKQRFIGHYDDEEEAAVDYARALFKYKGQGALDDSRMQSSLVIDLSDTPTQPPILKSSGRIKEGASKYIGVHLDKRSHKWVAQIMIDGKQSRIGSYVSEEEAAIDYARALVKYKGQAPIFVDLSDAPTQPPILKSSGRVKEGASKYTGVWFEKATKKWVAQIMIDGKQNRIGSYVSEKEAAVDYARASFKYKVQARAKKQKKLDVQCPLVIDLSDVPSQPPILKSSGRVKEGASKYTGVSFVKQMKKWIAQIMINGKQNRIGYYDNEEEAAIDYARAVVKYKGKELDFTDVPQQPPIPKSAGRIKEGASKYTGVFFDKTNHKWVAQITINGKQRRIGYYDNEEEAAADYARAAFKCKPKKPPKDYASYSRQLDTKDIPDQLLRNNEKAKSGFKASLDVETLGTFDTKDAAAGIHAYSAEKREKRSKKKEQRAASTMPDESNDVEVTI